MRGSAEAESHEARGIDEEIMREQPGKRSLGPRGSKGCRLLRLWMELIDDLHTFIDLIAS